MSSTATVGAIVSAAMWNLTLWLIDALETF
jgi:hypothetical protein